MKVKGFTLIELIVTLLIGSILLAWGVPNYRDFKLRREMVDNTNDIVYSMNLARAEAVRYGTNVTIAPTDGSDWQQGWTITAEGVGGALPTIIEQHDPVTAIDFGSVPDNAIVFNRLGGLTGSAPIDLALTHHADNTKKRIVTIRMSGTVKVKTP